MNKRKICIVIASRANYARIKNTLLFLKDSEKVELQLVVGGSALIYQFGKVIDEIQNEFSNIYKASFVVSGNTPSEMAKSTGLAIIELTTIFETIKPDIVLTIADRYETMATAIAASYMNIPLAHTQGGELTGSIDESVRHSISKFAHLHFPCTNRAKNILIQLGENKKNIILSGCPSIDLALEAASNFDPNRDLFKIYGGTGKNLDWSKEFVVVLQHPVTTDYKSTESQIKQTIDALREIKTQIVWLWPNVDAGSDIISKKLRELRTIDDCLIRFYRNFKPHDYIHLLMKSKMLIGNSSSGIRECASLGIPSVNIGNRQSKRERGPNVQDTDYQKAEIINCIKNQWAVDKYPRSNLYGDGNASKIIAKTLENHPLTIEKHFYEI